jgi:hypothetical protein
MQKIMVITMVSEKTPKFPAKNCRKISVNCDHNIDPRPDETTVIPKLELALKDHLGDLLNVQWIRNGSWPTLGEAVRQDKRVFAVIREKEPVDPDDDIHHVFIREIQERILRISFSAEKFLDKLPPLNCTDKIL